MSSQEASWRMAMRMDFATHGHLATPSSKTLVGARN
jgi:hypothetical protein